MNLKEMCLKNSLRQLFIPLCGKSGSDAGSVAGFIDRIKAKSRSGYKKENGASYARSMEGPQSSNPLTKRLSRSATRTWYPP